MKNNKQPKKNKSLKNTQQDNAKNGDKYKSLEELYNKGKRRYVILHGVLSWGVSTAIIFLLITSLFQYGFHFQEIIDSFFSKKSLITLAIFIVAGFVWGNIMWKVITREVEKNRNTKKDKRN